MTLIDPAHTSAEDLVKRLAAELIWELPPAWVELRDELEPSDDTPPEWEAVVKSTFTEALDEPGTVVQRWFVWFGHDNAGNPLGARLTRGPLEITHSGWSRVCKQTLGGDELVDCEEDDDHIHRRWYLAPFDGHSLAHGTEIDPQLLIAAIVEARVEVGVSRDEDPPDRWQRAVAELVVRKRRVVPEDLLPLLADQTIAPGWGSMAEWLRRPGVLIAPKVSMRCLPATDSEAADYKVSMRFNGHLEESGREAYAIADDLEGMLSNHFCRTFEVDVVDVSTGIRGRSGELP